MRFLRICAASTTSPTARADCFPARRFRPAPNVAAAFFRLFLRAANAYPGEDLRAFTFLTLALTLACGGGAPDASTPVHELPSDAQASNGDYICWKEHLVDDESKAGGVPLRGPVALVIDDFDRDGAEDVVVAYAESAHIRISYGTEGAPDEWFRLSLAEGPEVEGLTGVATGDWNGDGWLDLVVEGPAPLYLENPASEHRGFRWKRLESCEGCTPDAVETAPLPGSVSLSGYAQADIDQDGDPDALGDAGGGGIAWFQNDGDKWTRHDIVRRADGAYPAWSPRDMDGDGDIDFLGVRSGSGKLDGLMWLEQQRAPSAVQRHQPARAEGDSEALPAL